MGGRRALNSLMLVRPQPPEPCPRSVVEARDASNVEVGVRFVTRICGLGGWWWGVSGGGGPNEAAGGAKRCRRVSRGISAGEAQGAEHRTRNAAIVGSSPTAGSCFPV